jgi:hypothetical protein
MLKPGLPLTVTAFITNPDGSPIIDNVNKVTIKIKFIPGAETKLKFNPSSEMSIDTDAPTDATEALLTVTSTAKIN